MENIQFDNEICPLCKEIFDKHSSVLPCGWTICSKHIDFSKEVNQCYLCRTFNRPHDIIQSLIIPNLDINTLIETRKLAYAMEILVRKIDRDEDIKNNPEVFIRTKMNLILDQINMRKNMTMLTLEEHFEKIFRKIDNLRLEALNKKYNYIPNYRRDQLIRNTLTNFKKYQFRKDNSNALLRELLEWFDNLRKAKYDIISRYAKLDREFFPNPPQFLKMNRNEFKNILGDLRLLHYSRDRNFFDRIEYSIENDRKKLSIQEKYMHPIYEA
ncbi:unnamed protein product [Brachionus calyciflorus]|uniref:Uncharacterized protein n=1 Tax=Brachionus calyciflorus TaxID=104777 RepID=A0A814PJK7_9BILA|nr:unnamed protein product [Brachionus calyciflorus]